MKKMHPTVVHQVAELLGTTLEEVVWRAINPRFDQREAVSRITAVIESGGVVPPAVIRYCNSLSICFACGERLAGSAYTGSIQNGVRKRYHQACLPPKEDR